MKHITLLLLIMLFFSACNSESINEDPEEQACDGGTFTGIITLSTQTEVDDFGANCYTKIDGSLSLIDLDTTDDKIVDLTPLQNLTEVFTSDPTSSWATLRINTSLLTDLQGLNNLERVGRLLIQYNESLLTLNGLNSLTSIGTTNEVTLNELKITSNPQLQTLEGLDNLEIVGFGNSLTKLDIQGNGALMHLDHLNGLVEFNSSEPISGQGLSGNIWIFGNPLISHVNGLSNLSDIHGGNISFLFASDMVGSDLCDIYVANDNLTNYCGLQNLFTNGNYGNFTSGNGNCGIFEVSIQDIIDGNCSE